MNPKDFNIPSDMGQPGQDNSKAGKQDKPQEPEGKKKQENNNPIKKRPKDGEGPGQDNQNKKVNLKVTTQPSHNDIFNGRDKFMTHNDWFNGGGGIGHKKGLNIDDKKRALFVADFKYLIPHWVWTNLENVITDLENPKNDLPSWINDLKENIDDYYAYKKKIHPRNYANEFLNPFDEAKLRNMYLSLFFLIVRNCEKAQDDLLAWARNDENDFNILILYIDDLLDSSTSLKATARANLRDFIQKAYSKGITEVCANLSSEIYFNPPSDLKYLSVPYFNSQVGKYGFDSYMYEDEWWNKTNGFSGSNGYKDVSQEIKDYLSVDHTYKHDDGNDTLYFGTSLKNNTYFTQPKHDYETKFVADISDVVYLVYDQKTDNNFDYLNYWKQLEDLNKSGKQVNVMILFFCYIESKDPINQRHLFDSYDANGKLKKSFNDVYHDLLNSAPKDTSLDNINFIGYAIFDYEYAKKARP